MHWMFARCLQALLINLTDRSDLWWRFIPSNGNHIVEVKPVKYINLQSR